MGDDEESFLPPVLWVVCLLLPGISLVSFRRAARHMRYFFFFLSVCAVARSFYVEL